MVETNYTSTNASVTDAWDVQNLVYKDCPLTALSRVTANFLSSSLNNFKIIHSEGGYERDWRGLATLSQQRGLCADNTASNDPFDKVLKLWCENKPETATFGNLILYLGIIDRWHIIEDVHENLLKDYQDYQKASVRTSTNIEQSIQVSSGMQTNRENLNYDIEAKILTSNDVQSYQHGLPLEHYDAFILYADNDYKYALEILAKLQNNHLYNFKFCLKDDLLFGIPFEHIALMELIRERCTFLIAVLTKEFIKSPENRFFVNYAQALQIKQEIRKVIPLLYEDNVEIPANLAMFSRMRYNPYRTDLYWSKLADSMQLLQLNERVASLSAIAPCVVNNRRLEAAGSQQRNLAIENTKKRLALSSPSAQNEILAMKKRPTTKAKHLRTKTYLKTSLRYTNRTDSISLTSGEFESNNRSSNFFKKLICCRR